MSDTPKSMQHLVWSKWRLLYGRLLRGETYYFNLNKQNCHRDFTIVKWILYFPVLNIC